MTPQAYPLSWPERVDRGRNKRASQFKTSLSGALKNVRDSLRRFAADSSKAISEIVISSNVSLGNDNPADAGVAVWFMWDGELRCFAVDIYPKVQDNLQAIHHVLEARRTEMRHAGIAMTRAAMAGFTAALPPPGARPCWDVLGLAREAATPASINEAYRELAQRRHPDKPTGSDAAMAELNAARDQALKEIAK